MLQICMDIMGFDMLKHRGVAYGVIQKPADWAAL